MSPSPRARARDSDDTRTQKSRHACSHRRMTHRATDETKERSLHSLSLFLSRSPMCSLSRPERKFEQPHLHTNTLMGRVRINPTSLATIVLVRSSYCNCSFVRFSSSSSSTGSRCRHPRRALFYSIVYNVDKSDHDIDDTCICTCPLLVQSDLSHAFIEARTSNRAWASFHPIANGERERGREGKAASHVVCKRETPPASEDNLAVLFSLATFVSVRCIDFDLVNTRS